MAPEHRSFVGVGDEEYPVGDLEGTRPAGLGIHGEVLPPDVMLRMQYGDLMNRRIGVGGEEYIAERRQHVSVVESREQLPRVVQYYINMYSKFVGNGLLREHAKLKVQLDMNENDIDADIRSAVNRWIDGDIEINSALKRPRAFDLPSKRSWEET